MNISKRPSATATTLFLAVAFICAARGLKSCAPTEEELYPGTNGHHITQPDGDFK